MVAASGRALDGKENRVLREYGSWRSEERSITSLFVVRPEPAGLVRLKSEAAATSRQLPALAAQWLHRAQRNGGGIPISLRIEALQAESHRVGRSTDRLALALVALGLYIAASLLMQHSVGPRVFEAMPLFAAIGYVLALWFTLRIVRGIAGAERSSTARSEPS